MKPRILTNLILVLISISVFSQQSTFAPVELVKMDGTKIKASEINLGTDPVLLIFWKSSDERCCCHIDDINNIHNEALAENSFKLIGICCDATGTFDHVKPTVDGRCWEMDVYIDRTGEFRRSMGVSQVPFTVLFNQQQQVVCKYDGYCTSVDDLLCDKLQECLSSD